MPLGVYAVSSSQADDHPAMMMQMAVNKQGNIAGMYYNTSDDVALPIQGAVDEKTHCAAWSIGDKQNTVLETGIFNLTKDETPAAGPLRRSEDAAVADGTAEQAGIGAARRLRPAGRRLAVQPPKRQGPPPPAEIRRLTGRRGTLPARTAPRAAPQRRGCAATIDVRNVCEQFTIDREAGFPRLAAGRAFLGTHGQKLPRQERLGGGRPVRPSFRLRLTGHKLSN